MTDFDMMVVDVTLPAEDAVARVSQLKQYLGDQDTAVVLSLPGGSSAKMIALTVDQFATLSPTIGLTKLDECETAAAEFSALADLAHASVCYQEQSQLLELSHLRLPKFWRNILKRTFRQMHQTALSFSQLVRQKWSCKK